MVGYGQAGEGGRLEEGWRRVDEDEGSGVDVAPVDRVDTHHAPSVFRRIVEAP
jgi:hypothetical protein